MVRYIRRSKGQTVFKNDEWLPLKRRLALNWGMISRNYADIIHIYSEVIDYLDLVRITEEFMLSELTSKKNMVSVPKFLDKIEREKGINPSYDFQDDIIRFFERETDNLHTRALIGQYECFLEREIESDIGIFIPEILYEIDKIYDLVEEELAVLAVEYIIDEWNSFSAILRDFSIQDLYRFKADVCGITLQRYSDIVGSDGNLQKKGFIVNPDRGNYFSFELNKNLKKTLLFGSVNSLRENILVSKEKSEYQTHDFPVTEFDKKIIINSIKARKSVLIVGRSGIGKTLFADTIAFEAGYNLLELVHNSKSGFSDSSSLKNKMNVIRFAVHLIDKNSEMLLIDEADAILQSAGGFFSFLGGSGNYDKAELNELLEDIDVPVLWIANSIERMPASALRRFAYVYRFPEPDKKLRLKILKEKLDKEINIPLEGIAEDITRRYDLTPSAMDRMVSIIKDVVTINGESIDHKIVSDVVETFLDSVKDSPIGRDFRRLPSVSSSFKPEFCSTSVSLEEIVNRIRKRTNAGKSSRLLFEGQPGGGKTEFSLYLADMLGKEAVIQKPSDLLSPYVGVAEQNINAMFRRAEKMNAVLILDEADALLSDRSSAVRSWELSQASEFLQGIQNFKGTLIACTNRLNSIDPAIRRRFHQTITFGSIEKEMILPSLNHLFPDMNFTEEHIKRLESLPTLMMSDIANTSEILDTEELLESSVIINEIIENAKNRDMSKAIGF